MGIAGETGERDGNGLVGFDNRVVDNATHVDGSRRGSGGDGDRAGQRRVVGCGGRIPRDAVSDHRIGGAGDTLGNSKLSRLGTVFSSRSVVGRNGDGGHIVVGNGDRSGLVAVVDRCLGIAGETGERDGNCLVLFDNRVLVNTT